MFLVEYFLFVHFNTILNQDIVDIIGETNPVESSEFLSTYLSVGAVVVWGAALLLCLLLFRWLSFRLCRSVAFRWLSAVLTVFGLYISLYCCYGFVRYRNGMGYPQCTSVTRCGYSFFQVYQNWKQIDALREVCRTTVARQPVADSLGRRPKIVVVIGESYSVYHSGLYGYEKNTTPLLSAKQRKGELLVFDNAVSLFDFTHAVMRTVYSVGSYSEESTSKCNITHKV